MEIKADDILRAEIIFKQIQLIGLEQAEAIKKLQQANQNLIEEIQKNKNTIEILKANLDGLHDENQKLKEEVKRLETRDKRPEANKEDDLATELHGKTRNMKEEQILE